ncbi:MAG TPA: GNAT family N-acetyltransferase [Candidatus Angelobacter sp.]|nr:GNAT family N-acetyltransferase [Candidatus Angelobacter sp.]
MAIYTNPPGGVGGTRVNVTYHNAPVGPSGTHSIRYVGLDGAAGTHRGYLDYSVGGGTLSIHTVDATPQGSGLGSLLLYEAALRASFHGAARITALNVAANARGFYLRAGFHPSRAGRDLAEGVIATPAAPVDFGTRLALARSIGNWDAERVQIQNAAYAEINTHWL